MQLRWCREAEPLISDVKLRVHGFQEGDAENPEVYL
jgi:hypothetical protein